MKINNEQRKELIEMARKANWSNFDYTVNGCYWKDQKKRRKFYEKNKEAAVSDEAAEKTYRYALREVIEWGMRDNVTVGFEDMKWYLRMMINLEF